MTFYISCIILTELLMLAMVLHVLYYPGFTKQQKFWYLATFMAIMLCAAAEFVVHSGVYSVKMKGFLTVITVIQFSTAPLLAVLFSESLGLSTQKYGKIFAFISFTVEIIGAFTKQIFYFDETGYVRGPLFFVYEIFFGISLVYLIVSLNQVGRRFNHRDYRTITMIIVIVIFGIIPMVFYRINITYLAIAISASLCYMYYNDLVQQDIQEDLMENQKKMSDIQDHIIYSLASLIESRDMDTGEHVARTSEFVERLSRLCLKEGIYTDEIDSAFIEKMKVLAPLHDIGKIVVSDNILRKPGRLTSEEYEQMKKHAAAGGLIIRDVLNGVADEDYTDFAADIASYHHERWDGTGYPLGKKGEDIPLNARIMAVADVYDALVSERVYKEPYSFEKAVEIIKDESGSHFDPKLVDVFLKYQKEFEYK